MTAKHLSAASFFFMGVATLSAQAPAAFHHTGANDFDLNNLISQLVQNALLVLSGAVLLMGIGWLFSVWNACARLNKKQKNVRAPFFLWLCMAAGLGVLGSSCTAAQRVRAADIHASRASEGRYCSCHATDNNHQYAVGYAGIYNQYPYRSSNDTGRSFCRQCGLRIYYGNR